MNTLHVSKGHLREAEAIARRVPHVLQRRGLPPAFTDWLLTEANGLTWLFGAVDLHRVERLERYSHPDLLHHISTDIGGRPVYVSNSNGLRYGILLSAPPRLPRKADFPGLQRGQALLGQTYSHGPLTVTWARLKHLLVAVKTGAGKSNFLRLLVYQALAEGHRLLLADRDNTTFPMLANHPALLAPIAHDERALLEAVELGLGECEHRSALYGQVPGFPDKLEEYNPLALEESLEPLPRLLVVLDEFNAAVLAAGGASGPLATAVTELGWRGRKFGVHVIFAAQDFSKAVVGRIRDQITAAICFRVNSQAVARNVGCSEAVRIPETRPGLAITDRWGPVQTFYLPKALLIQAGQQPGAPPLTAQEQALIEHALAVAGGRITIPLLKEYGVTEWEARKLLEDWELRGWVEKDPRRDNARYVTPKLEGLLPV